MLFKFITPVAGLLLLSSTGNCTPTPPAEGVCVANNCFRALVRFSSEAIPFCINYIGVPTTTVTVATVTPTVTATITKYFQYPNIDKREEEEGILIPDDGSAVFGVDPGTEGFEMVRRDAVALPLPTYVSQYSEKEVSSACSCMSITQPIESATATAPPTTVTTTVSVGTDDREKCDTGYNTWGNGSGNRLELYLQLPGESCCRKCHRRSDCVASASFLIVCQLLINDRKVKGEETSKQCPLGIENFNFGTPSKFGLVYPGPCGV